MEYEQHTDEGENIKCPYCLAERNFCMETDYNENGFEEECWDCGNTYIVTASCLWLFIASRDCRLNNKKHKYKQYYRSQTDEGIDLYLECTRCGKIVCGDEAEKLIKEES
jgi:hypothetical protein